MLEKMRNAWQDLDRDVPVNQQKLVLGATVAALAGIVLGMLWSPRKTVTVGSHNGSDNYVEKLEEAQTDEGEDE